MSNSFVVDVIIVNFNCSSFVIECINSLIYHTKISYKLIVVDSASNQDDRTILKGYIDALPMPTTFLQLDINRGFGYANNASLGYLTAPYVLLLNPDTKFINHAVDDCLESLSSDSEYGCVAPLLINGDGSSQTNVYQFPTIGTTINEFFFRKWKMPSVSKFGALLEVEGVTGAFMLIDRKVIERVGLFDTRFFMYMEEVDLCKRISMSGYKIGLLTKSPVIHYGGGSSSEAVRPSLYREMYRSRLLYFRKHYAGLYAQSLILGVKVGLFINSFIEIIKTVVKGRPAIAIVNSMRVAFQVLIESW